MFTEHLLFGSYREAMRALLLNPERAKQLTCLHQLIGYLLSKQQADVLVGMYFSNLGDDVANILEAKCRIESTNDLPTMSTMYNITYAFHLNRCNYSRGMFLWFRVNTYVYLK
jgi:hypothetical protein